MRLIDADVLTMLLHDDIDGLDKEFPNDKQVKPYMCGVRMALSFIETAPTIDAVPVVRCKECKHCNTDLAMGKWYGSCKIWNTHSVMADWYCVNGERKDDECMERNDDARRSNEYE